MKRYIRVALLLLAIIFIFSGCGGKTATSVEVEGVWKCVDVEIKENGKTIAGKEEYEQLMGMSIGELYKLTVYSDGNADFTMMGELIPLKWTEENGEYTVNMNGQQEPVVEEGTGDTMSMSFKNGIVTMSMTDAITSTDENGVETKLEEETILTFEPTGENGSKIKNMDIALTDDETTSMSNFMNFGQYIYVDKTLYGKFMDNKFVMAKVNMGNKKAELKDKNVIMEDCIPYYLCENDGYIYAVLNANGEYSDQRIVKIKEGSTEMETLYEGQCSYLQIVGDQLYFTDKNWNYCKMNFDGKEKTTVIEKECYYPYVLNEQWIIYQDDDADESIHLYNYKAQEDIAVTTHRAYHPVIHGDYIYFMDYEDKSLPNNVYNFARFNLYSGETSLYKENFAQYFFITGDKVYFEEGGCPASNLPDEWNTLFGTNFGGLVYRMAYSDNDIQVYCYDDGRIFAYKTGMQGEDDVATKLELE